MKRTSDLLNDIVQSSDSEQITIGDFAATLGHRSFALAILIFSLPNSLPIPTIPGFSTFTGVIILFISLQIVWGRQSIWLPRKVAERHFHHKMMAKIIGKSIPAVKWAEKFTHRRLHTLCKSHGERIIGFCIAVMAFILILPIFGGNFLPGLAITLLAFAILERDGVFAVLSIAFSIVTAFVMYEVVAAIAGRALHWFG